MSEGESPKSQIRSSVRDCTQYEFNGLNHLVDKQVRELMVITTFIQANQQGFSNSEVLLVILGNCVSLLESIVILKLILVDMSIILVRIGDHTRLDAEHDWDTADSNYHHQLHNEGLESLSPN